MSPRLGTLDAELDSEGDLEKLLPLDAIEIVDVSDIGLDTTDIILKGGLSVWCETLICGGGVFKPDGRCPRSGGLFRRKHTYEADTFPTYRNFI